jgi:hypothetical protein
MPATGFVRTKPVAGIFISTSPPRALLVVYFTALHRPIFKLQ